MRRPTYAELRNSIENEFSGWRVLCNRLTDELAALEANRDLLRARLSEIYSAPTVAVVDSDRDQDAVWPILEYDDLPPYGTELIVRPKPQ